jgi:cytoskeleton protein RodZ
MNALLVPDTEGERAEVLRQGPGQALRVLREAQGLHLADVAHALHLSPATLEQLERDDFASLPNSVFVQGYLRNYARFLGEPVAPYLQAFNQLRPDPKEECQDLRASRVPIKIEVRSNHLAVRLVSWGIAIALLALLAIWGKDFLRGYGELLDTGSLGLLDSEPAAERAPLTLQVPLEQPLSQPAPPPAADAPKTDVPTAEVPASDAASSDAPGEAASSATPSRPTQPAAPAGEGQTPARPATAQVTTEAQRGAETDSDAAAGPTSDQPVVQPGGYPGGYQVVLEVVGKSWVDVRDANGKLVVVGELAAGERRELTGKPPFTFVFGKASRVRMTVNGKPFDIEPHSRRDVARFTLDPTQG